MVLAEEQKNYRNGPKGKLLRRWASRTPLVAIIMASSGGGLPEGAVPIYADDPSLPPGATDGLAELMGSLEEKVHEMAREAGNAPQVW